MGKDRIKKIFNFFRFKKKKKKKKSQGKIKYLEEKKKFRMVLISRENRNKVYEYLLQEGVIVIKKEFNFELHADTKVPNLHVWMLLRSLHSKGIVDLVFNWLYYYYNVKDTGVKFLRDALGIVEERVVPNTFKKVRKDYVGRDENEEEDRPGRGGRGGGGGGRGGRGYGRGRGETRREDEEGGEQQEEAGA